MKRFGLLFIFLVCLSCGSFAQDVVYLLKGKKQAGKLMEIDGDKFKFRNPDDRLGPVYTAKVSGVVLAFNYRADYIAFKDGARLFSNEELNTFIYPRYELRRNDLVIDKTEKIFTAKITSTDKDDFVGGFANGASFKIPKADMIAILRKDGTHQLFVSAENAMSALSNVKPRIKQLLEKPEEEEPAGAPVPATTLVVVPTSSVAIIKTDPAKPALSPLDMKAFRQKSSDKVKEFTGYLSSLIDAGNIDQQTKIQNLACDLFVDENAQVETSSVYSQKKKKTKIRTYLEKLTVRSGKFDKIKVEYADISYASDFKPGADGRYYGSVTFVQKFEGFMDNEMVYGDMTTRSATVVLKQYSKAVEGGYVKIWDVFLGDIGVKETQKLQ